MIALRIVLMVSTVILAQPCHAQDSPSTKYKLAVSALGVGDCKTAVPLLEEYTALKSKELSTKPDARIMLSKQIDRCKTALVPVNGTKDNIVIKGAVKQIDMRSVVLRGMVIN